MNMVPNNGKWLVTKIHNILWAFFLLFCFLLQQTRLIQSKRRFYESTFCSGGDNNPGLIVSARNETDEVFAVNDSIVGRPSSGFIAKVNINIYFTNELSVYYSCSNSVLKFLAF